jgi:hypothetical protein
MQQIVYRDVKQRKIQYSSIASQFMLSVRQPVFTSDTRDVIHDSHCFPRD